MPTVPHQAVLLFGPTGSGKTPLGDLLESAGLWGRACHHFDFGENLRRIVREGGGADEFSRDEMDFLTSVLEEGVLLEDESFCLAEKILRGFIKAREVARDDLMVMNGLPRHIGQAASLAHRIRVIAVVELACDPDTVLLRLQRDSGGDRAGRIDDDGELVARKMAIYAERTRPLADHYREEGARCVRVRVGVDTPCEEMRRQIESIGGVARK